MNYKQLIQEEITKILLDTDSVTIRELNKVVDKLNDDGFTEETILDELKSLHKRLIDFDKSTWN